MLDSVLKHVEQSQVYALGRSVLDSQPPNVKKFKWVLEGLQDVDAKTIPGSTEALRYSSDPRIARVFEALDAAQPHTSTASSDSAGGPSSHEALRKLAAVVLEPLLNELRRLWLLLLVERQEFLYDALAAETHQHLQRKAAALTLQGVKRGQILQTLAAAPEQKMAQQLRQKVTDRIAAAAAPSAVQQTATASPSSTAAAMHTDNDEDRDGEERSSTKKKPPRKPGHGASKKHARSSTASSLHKTKKAATPPSLDAGNPSERRNETKTTATTKIEENNNISSSSSSAMAVDSNAVVTPDAPATPPVSCGSILPVSLSPVPIPRAQEQQQQQQPHNKNKKRPREEVVTDERTHASDSGAVASPKQKKARLQSSRPQQQQQQPQSQPDTRPAPVPVKRAKECLNIKLPGEHLRVKFPFFAWVKGTHPRFWIMVFELVPPLADTITAKLPVMTAADMACMTVPLDKLVDANGQVLYQRVLNGDQGITLPQFRRIALHWAMWNVANREPGFRWYPNLTALVNGEFKKNGKWEGARAIDADADIMTDLRLVGCGEPPAASCADKKGDVPNGSSTQQQQQKKPLPECKTCKHWDLTPETGFRLLVPAERSRLLPPERSQHAMALIDISTGFPEYSNVVRSFELRLVYLLHPKSTFIKQPMVPKSEKKSAAALPPPTTTAQYLARLTDTFVQFPVHYAAERAQLCAELGVPNWAEIPPPRSAVPGLSTSHNNNKNNSSSSSSSQRQEQQNPRCSTSKQQTPPAKPPAGVAPARPRHQEPAPMDTLDTTGTKTTTTSARSRVLPTAATKKTPPLGQG